MTMLAAFKVLLYRYTGQEDICVGTPVAGRSQKELEELIGFFVNTLALRSQVRGNMAFSELLEEIKTTTLEAYSYQEAPFEKVVDAVVKERDMSRSPLFQVMFVFQNTPEVPELKLGEVSLSIENQEQTTSLFDIAFLFSESSSGLQGIVEYNIDLYKKETIDRMIAHYINLLDSIVTSPEELISRLGMLSVAEEKALLKDFNATAVAYPKDKNIVSLIEEQVASSPKATALVFENEQLTYGELNKRSNQLAHYLQKKGVKAETLVPICVERSLEMVIGILGILKAGGVYVPIDPDYPADRISYMLEDTGAELVLSSKVSREKLNGPMVTSVIELDSDWEQIEKEKNSNLQTEIHPEQLAYIIYTSGSTGKPKGVMIEHGSVLNYLINGKTNFIDKEQREGSGSFMQLSYTFDASLTPMFIPLLSGKTVVLSSKVAMDVFEDDNLLKYAPYDFINITPSHLELLYAKINDFSGGLLTQKLVIGGEALVPGHLMPLIEKGINIEIINLYGPTEATIGCTTYCFNLLSSDEKIKNIIPIGKPIDNTQLYLLDSDRRLVPVGVSGEIYIGGIQVARGYLNREELTIEKFISDPFSSDPGARLYKTGDLGRWLPDGNIEYLGRIDDQVKIRGFRIELGEIENVLNQSEQVSQGVVLAIGDNGGNKRLVGYVVPQGVFDKQEIQNYLSTKLPDYMVPALWVELELIPLTSNGKVDRKALPEPELTTIAKTYAAPRNETEQALSDIWQELLGLERVGIYDNFFELGGDSILTIQVVSRMRRLGHIIQPKDIFNYQSIATLSEVLKHGINNGISGEQGILSGIFSLIPIQSSYFEKEQKEISHFNQSILLKINKKITIAMLQAALDNLRSQHDALRLVFKKSEGIWQQEYGMEHLQLNVEDLTGASKESLAEKVKIQADKYQRSLSIEHGQLMRMVLMQTPEHEEADRLLIVIHHLGVDGVSWRILLEDLERLLSGLIDDQQVSLGDKSSSYRQWYAAQEQYSQSKRLLEQKSYWEQIVSSYEPFARDSEYSEDVLVKDMNDYQVKLGAEQTRYLLQEVPKVYHTEINDLLMGALCAALCEWSGKAQVVIGLEGHGREVITQEIDTSRTVGWFTSLYPVLLKTSTDADTLIKSVKEEMRRVPDKGLGYGVLKYINKEEKLQGRDPWDLVFNYMGQLDTAAEKGSWLSVAEEPSGSGVSEEQVSVSILSVNSHIFEAELVLNWSYSSRHYNQDTISKIAGEYINQLLRLIAHCEEQLKSGVIYTPADYGLGAEISFEELDRFLEEPYMDDDIMSF
jgi:amino acid adenylation domain-containing protein/non-ribosomal peptide synthase protein (TIGR01720 family)